VPVKIEELGKVLEIDLSSYGPDTQVSEIVELASATLKGLEYLAIAKEQYGTEEITLADFFRSYHRRGAFKEIVGGPKRVADVLELWLNERAVDACRVETNGDPDVQRKSVD
jgi:hypothetical protein